MANVSTTTRFIVVVFIDGVGCTLQEGDVVAWFLRHYAKAYKYFECARKKANTLLYQYRCSKVCVFKVELEERLSCDQYEKWCKDENRNMWDSSKLFNDIDIRL